jgi:hypothetical protein
VTYPTHGITLSPGWNLVSSRLEPPFPAPEEVFRSIDSHYCRVLGELGIYDCNIDPVYQTLRELHSGKAYYLRIEGDTGVDLQIEGPRVPVDTPLPLHEGWNWVGYLPDTALPIETALQSIEGRVLLVLSIDQVYDPAQPLYSTLTHMEPGQGYLIRTTEPVDLIYPTESGQALQAQPRLGACDEVSPTPYVTLIYGEITVGGAPAAPGTAIQVLTPRGEVAGCSVVEHTGHFGYIQVYGQDQGEPAIPGFRQGEPLAFLVNGAEAAPSVELLWAGDMQPHEVDLSVSVYQTYLPLVRKVH